MILLSRNIVASFLLIIFAAIFYLSAKANFNQMQVQTTATSSNQRPPKTYLALGDSYTIGL